MTLGVQIAAKNAAPAASNSLKILFGTAIECELYHTHLNVKQAPANPIEAMPFSFATTA
jgi:hypothetical protein